MIVIMIWWLVFAIRAELRKKTHKHTHVHTNTHTHKHWPYLIWTLNYERENLWFLIWCKYLQAPCEIRRLLWYTCTLMWFSTQCCHFINSSPVNLGPGRAWSRSWAKQTWTTLCKVKQASQPATKQSVNLTPPRTSQLRKYCWRKIVMIFPSSLHSLSQLIDCNFFIFSDWTMEMRLKLPDFLSKGLLLCLISLDMIELKWLHRRFWNLVINKSYLYAISSFLV